MRVLIAGGGIGGLALAAALARRRIEARVFEKTGEYRPCGAALTMWPNGMRALGMLGADVAVARRGWPITASLIRLPRGEVISETPTGAVSREAGFATVAIRRADLQASLLEVVRPEVIRMASPLAAIRERGGGVEVEVGGREDTDSQSGISGTESTERGDILVGADGLHSRVREHMVAAREPSPLGFTLWRGIVACGDADLLEGRAFETWAPGVRFGMVQVDAGHAYWYAGLNDDAVSDSATDLQGKVRGTVLERMRGLFAGWHDPIPAVLDAMEPDEVMRTVIYDRPALASWSRGRVALLGDAAHPMTPDLGQGACSAIEDAVVLAECLSSARDHAAAFARYEAARRPLCTRVAAKSRRMGLMCQWRSRPLCAARNAVTRMVPRGVLHRGLLGMVKR